MKKLNNKGFAIGTILYGLLIVMVLLMSLLMSTMAFGRSNSKKYVDEIVNNLEMKEEDPPKVTIVDIPKTLTPKPPYQSLTITFRIKIEDQSSIIVNSGFATYMNAPIDCKLDDSSTSNNKLYNCNIIVPNENAIPGYEVKINIAPNKIRDRFHNRYENTDGIPLNYKFEDDKTPPTMTPYRISVSNDRTTYKILVCDNSGEKVTIDYSKANNITVNDKNGEKKVSATEKSNCQLVSFDSSVIEKANPIPVKIPEGVFQDKYKNGNQESTINFFNPRPNTDEFSKMNDMKKCKAYAYILTTTNDEDGLLLTPEFKNKMLKYQVKYKVNSGQTLDDSYRVEYSYNALRLKCNETNNNKKLRIKYRDKIRTVDAYATCDMSDKEKKYIFTYEIKQSTLDDIKKESSNSNSRLYLEYPLKVYKNSIEQEYQICNYLQGNYYIDTGLDY